MLYMKRSSNFIEDYIVCSDIELLDKVQDTLGIKMGKLVQFVGSCIQENDADTNGRDTSATTEALTYPTASSAKTPVLKQRQELIV